jgi:excinuclease ABC subunit A
VVHVLSELDGLRAAMMAGVSAVGIGRVNVFSTLRACPVCSTSYAELDPRLFSYNSKHGWCPDCVGTGVKLNKDQRKVFDDSVRDDDNKGREQTFAEPEVEDLADTACPTCQGTRLNATARAVGFGTAADGSGGIGITEFARMSVTEVRQWFEGLVLKGREAEIARDLVPEIKSRLEFLEEVGLGYLTLDRGAPTLSGGEAQRIRLAAQLGSNLQGVCYVLDEPTIGLHARDNQILLNALHKLGEKGNTLVVVEHDEDTIRRADHIIDIGPSAGKRGGRLVAEGSVSRHRGCERIADGPLPARCDQASVAGAAPGSSPSPSGGEPGRGHAASKKAAGRANAASPHPKAEGRERVRAQMPMRGSPCIGADLHNLQDVTATLPLHRLVVVTGVSGSGKSTLARDVLLANVQAIVIQRMTKAGRDADAAGKRPAWAGCSSVDGYEAIDRVLEVDQTPIGKTPRSPARPPTSVSGTPSASCSPTRWKPRRAATARRASASTPAKAAARAATVQGVRTIEMSFLPDVKVPCEVCHGARFNPETLAVSWRGKSIGDVLQMEVDEAVEFFAPCPTSAIRCSC